jgi:hypothetical protein
MVGIPLLLRSNMADSGSSAGSVVPPPSLLHSRTAHSCRSRAETEYDRVRDPDAAVGQAFISGSYWLTSWVIYSTPGWSLKAIWEGV